MLYLFSRNFIYHVFTCIFRVPLAHQAHQVRQVNEDLEVNQGPQELMDLKVLLVNKDHQDWMV